MYAEKLWLSRLCAVLWEFLSNYKAIKRAFSKKQTVWGNCVTSPNDRSLLSFPLVSQQGESHRQLYRELLKNYNRLEQPVMNHSQPLVVELQLSLVHIIDVVSYSVFCSLRHPVSIKNLLSGVGTIVFLLTRLTETKADCLWPSILSKCWSTCFDTLEDWIFS